MKVINITPPRLILSRFYTLIILIVCLGLSGCITSPFFNQEFSSRSDEIPFTVWTFDKTKPVTIECAPLRGAFSVVPAGTVYRHVATISPDDQGMLDAEGQIIYSVSTKQVLPRDCWHNLRNRPGYSSSIRVLQDGSDSGIFTFDKPGLECLGRWIGHKASWVGWFGHNCNKNFLGTTTAIKSVLIKAST
jgi:hypothetical protein